MSLDWAFADIRPYQGKGRAEQGSEADAIRIKASREGGRGGEGENSSPLYPLRPPSGRNLKREAGELRDELWDLEMPR